MAKKERWVVFDADNTLWDIEYLYDDARKAFCTYALNTLDAAGENSGGQVTLDMLDKAQRHRDIQLLKTHGYSSSRFARSFEDTLMFFMQYAPLEAIIHVRHIAQEVFEKPARIVDNLESILLRLSHKYSLAIITAGERWVQEKRLKDFHLSDQFKQTLIVERKTPDVFREFCKGNKVSPGSCWVVGDSVRSDIVPATKAGLRAIHIYPIHADLKSRTSSSSGQFLPVAHGALPALLPRGATTTLARRGSDFLMWDPTAEPDRVDRRCGFRAVRAMNGHRLLLAQLEIEDPQVLGQAGVLVQLISTLDPSV